MNDIKQFKSILKQGISRNTDVLLGCEFLEKLLNIINDYENTKNQLQQKDNIIKEVREYITRKDICIDTRKTDGSLDYVDLKKELLEILDKGE